MLGSSVWAAVSSVSINLKTDRLRLPHPRRSDKVWRFAAVLHVVVETGHLPYSVAGVEDGPEGESGRVLQVGIMLFDSYIPIQLDHLRAEWGLDITGYSLGSIDLISYFMWKMFCCLLLFLSEQKCFLRNFNFSLGLGSLLISRMILAFEKLNFPHLSNCFNL